MKLQKGFTLIELMIVIAIIAILAAIAIPAYQDFLIRSRVTDMNTQAGACKSSVGEYYASRGFLPVLNADAGCANAATENASAPAVAAGRITVVASTELAAVLNGKTPPGDRLVLQPACGTGGASAALAVYGGCALAAGAAGADIQRWDCDAVRTATGGAPTNIQPKYLPAQCRT